MSGADVPSGTRDTILESTRRARSDVEDAARALDVALSELNVVPRAEKTAVTQVIQDAFSKLRAARSALEELELLLKRDVSLD